MKKLCVTFAIILLLLVVDADGRPLIFAYGGDCFCEQIERIISQSNTKWKVFCYRGNPYASGSTLSLMAKLQPDVVMFPKSLYQLFVESGFTGSVTYYRQVTPFAYLGVWAGSENPEAKSVVNRLAAFLYKVGCAKETLVVPNGWWIDRLGNVQFKEKETRIRAPIKGVQAGIYRYKVKGIPRKVFLVKLPKPAKVVSTLEGFGKVSYVGNVYLFPSLWRTSFAVKQLKRNSL